MATLLFLLTIAVIIVSAITDEQKQKERIFFNEVFSKQLPAGMRRQVYENSAARDRILNQLRLSRDTIKEIAEDFEDAVNDGLSVDEYMELMFQVPDKDSVVMPPDEVKKPAAAPKKKKKDETFKKQEDEKNQTIFGRLGTFLMLLMAFLLVFLGGGDQT